MPCLVTIITIPLAGRAPGLLVTTSGGGLNNFSSVSIRGGGTPLYVIDDVISEERDFRNLNAEDIDQITILKDAASTAVYGARPARLWVMFAVGALIMSSVLTLAMAAVVLRLEVVP